MSLVAPTMILASGGGGIMSPEPGTMFWSAVSFLVTLLILVKFAWKPILTGLQAREESIRKALEEAQKSRTEAREILGQYEVKLSAAREEAHSILDESKRDAEVVKSKVITEAKQEAEDLSRRSLREIELAKAKALEELREATAALSMEIASKVLGRAVTPEDHRRLIDETIAKYKSGSPGLN